jgi:hypothetical protein
VLQIGIVVLLAGIAMVPAVLFIPRDRQSPWFDRILWLGTWLLAILGAYALPSFLGANSPLNVIILFETPIVSNGLGAIIGAFALNILLWLVDRSSPVDHDDTDPNPLDKE